MIKKLKPMPIYDDCASCLELKNELDELKTIADGWRKRHEIAEKYLEIAEKERDDLKVALAKSIDRELIIEAQRDELKAEYERLREDYESVLRHVGDTINKIPDGVLKDVLRISIMPLEKFTKKEAGR